MLKIEIKPLARNDLLGIWDYTFQEWGAAQADVYLQDLENAFSKLASSPLLGRSVDEIRPSLRLHPYNHHIIIYQVNDASIVIVRVLHKRMDITRHRVQ
ncbi:type II toxin-antitoxin system RelE/ParE family toxin [Planctobacterium marinum]|uniref:type II toxin-antitoxin system RelE/ParE family toxin n=1 Tax=Planctobacterium marinum TaxID=1631968 RepID=UPI001E2DB68E|nr:type II toxin-antitoxin system RelE/ParE family toxin [Planctobacterium marinum]MCC2604086.1 type II toxin-antitoxin system RelE/ParE family toxin [Planctobacterium marinum]